MKTKECMTKDIVIVKTEDTICSVAKLMNDNHIGGVPVCDNNDDVVGIITDRDIILRSIACDKDVKQTLVTDIMTKDIVTVTPDTEINEVSKIMSENQIRRVPVVEDNKVVGIISIGDLIRNTKISEDQVSSTMEWICSCNKNS